MPTFRGVVGWRRTASTVAQKAPGRVVAFPLAQAGKRSLVIGQNFRFQLAPGNGAGELRPRIIGPDDPICFNHSRATTRRRYRPNGAIGRAILILASRLDP